MSLVFAVPGGFFAALVLAVAFGALVVLEARRGARGGALLLRVVTALCCWAIAAQPRWRGARVESSEGRVAVLVDTSRSMTVDLDGETRAEAAASVLTRWRDEGTEGAELFRFGMDVGAVTWGQPLDAHDDESRLAAALEDLSADEGLGAIVVLSDGAQSDGAFTPSGEGPRIHTIALGGDDDIRDDSVAELAADPVAFLRQEAQVKLVVRRLGGSAGPIPVTLRQDDQVVREVVVDVEPGGEAEVVLGFTPRRLGRSVFRVSIPVEDGDAVPANNERAFLVRVTRDKLRVLLVAGQPTWDVRFLRAFFERDPSIDLISFFILRTTADMTMASPDELALIPFPTDELFREHLGSFDVLFFQNFDYGPYQMASYLPRIRDYVKRGGAFAMIGGDRSFASGGYAGTPLADILPVTLPAGAPGVSSEDDRLLDTAPFSPVLSRDMARHPLLALLPEPAANAAAWQALAPLEGTNVIEGVRGDANVLLTHPRLRAGGEPMPVLVSGEIEEGRVLAFTADTSWRWGITTGGETGDASAHERFWDRALRWLSRDPALEPARLTTDRERYGPEARVRVRGSLRDAGYRPLTGREISLGIRRGDGRELTTRPLVLGGEGEVDVAFDGPLESGAYAAFAKLDGEVIAEEGFVVETGGDELADPRPRPDRLEALANASGGRFIDDPANVPSLRDFDATRTRVLGSTEHAPFASPWAMAVALGLLAAEWWWRRRRGAR